MPSSTKNRFPCLTMPSPCCLMKNPASRDSTNRTPKALITRHHRLLSSLIVHRQPNTRNTATTVVADEETTGAEDATTITDSNRTGILTTPGTVHATSATTGQCSHRGTCFLNLSRNKDSLDHAPHLHSLRPALLSPLRSNQHKTSQKPLTR